VKLKCYTHDKSVFELQKLEYKTKPPSWWKKIKNFAHKFDIRSGVNIPVPTIKTCPGVADYIRKPITLKLWSDVIFNIKPDGKVKLAEPIESFNRIGGGVHEDYQYGKELYPGRTVFKLYGPWAIEGSDRTEFMLKEIHYSEDLRKHDILISPGIANFKDQHTLNVFLVFPIKEEEYTVQLKYGTPIMSIYPMTDKKVELEHYLIPKTEWDAFQNNYPSTFLGRYYAGKHARSD